MTQRKKKRTLLPYLEIAKVDVVYDKYGQGYLLAVFGNSTNENPVPCVHICKVNDAEHQFKHFNLELSLVDLLVSNKWILLRKTDSEFRINEKQRTADWFPFDALKNAIQERFASKSDLLAQLIHAWNRESDIEKTANGGNPLKEWLDERNLKVHQHYKALWEEICTQI